MSVPLNIAYQYVSQITQQACCQSQAPQQSCACTSSTSHREQDHNTYVGQTHPVSQQTPCVRQR